MAAHFHTCKEKKPKLNLNTAQLSKKHLHFFFKWHHCANYLMCPRQMHRNTEEILCSHLVSLYLNWTAWSTLSLPPSVIKPAKLAVCAVVVISLMGFLNKHGEARGLMLDLVFIYSITMGGPFDLFAWLYNENNSSFIYIKTFQSNG